MRQFKNLHPTCHYHPAVMYQRHCDSALCASHSCFGSPHRVTLSNQHSSGSTQRRTWKQLLISTQTILRKEGKEIFKKWLVSCFSMKTNFSGCLSIHSPTVLLCLWNPVANILKWGEREQLKEDFSPVTFLKTILGRKDSKSRSWQSKENCCANSFSLTTRFLLHGSEKNKEWWRQNWKIWFIWSSAHAGNYTVVLKYPRVAFLPQI